MSQCCSVSKPTDRPLWASNQLFIWSLEYAILIGQSYHPVVWYSLSPQQRCPGNWNCLYFQAWFLNPDDSKDFIDLVVSSLNPNFNPSKGNPDRKNYCLIFHLLVFWSKPMQTSEMGWCVGFTPWVPACIWRHLKPLSVSEITPHSNIVH